MKKFLAALCMAGALAGLSSCKTAQSAASTMDALEGEWKITTVEGQPITPKIQADPEKGTMSFGQTGSTRMMCPDMETEQKVLGAMGKVAGYEITKDGKMSLKAGDGKVVMTLEKR